MAAEIVAVREGPELEAVRVLFLEYGESLGRQICFEEFEAELAGLPGDYAAPRGALFLARADGAALGCAALRPLGDREAELKRLYVRTAARGQGLGRRLAEEVVATAERMGYATLRLDTLPGMHEAHVLYASLGFRETTPYRPDPAAGVTFMAMDLAVE